MSPSSFPNLSRSELDLIKILWRREECNVRAVHERLAAGYDWTYSTTRTTMERMVKKGYLNRREEHGVYLYSAAISRPAGLAAYVREFADRILELHHDAVVALFARSEALTDDEVDELARLLDDAEAMETGEDESHA